jgi:hypothetical protein
MVRRVDVTSEAFRALQPPGSDLGMFSSYVFLSISVVVLSFLIVCYFVALLRINPQLWVMSFEFKAFVFVTIFASIASLIFSLFVVSVWVKLALVCFVCLYCVMVLYFLFKLYLEVS